MSDFRSSGGGAGDGGGPHQRILPAAPGSTVRALDFPTMDAEVKALLAKQLFFVGGLARSGTTWLQVLLDLHPQVSCGNEGHFVNNLFPKLKEALENHNELLTMKAGREFGEFNSGFPLFEYSDLRYLFACGMLLLLAKRARGRQVLAVGEKTPENVQTFRSLASLFPGVKCIHMVRDPRDAAVSGWFHVLRVIPDETRAHFATMSDYLRYYVRLWTDEVGAGVAFGVQNAPQYHEVRYEDLIAAPEQTLTRVFRFLGVDDGDSVVRRSLEGANFERMSGGRARGSEKRDSFFRKGVTGDWKNHFDAPTLQFAIDTAGAMMRRFGYL